MADEVEEFFFVSGDHVRPHESFHELFPGRNLRIVLKVDVQSGHRFRG
ncbi:MAG: hypothetical protein V3U46_08390 [Acidimicrobiia bacterium]